MLKPLSHPHVNLFQTLGSSLHTRGRNLVLLSHVLFFLFFKWEVPLTLKRQMKIIFSIYCFYFNNKLPLSFSVLSLLLISEILSTKRL